MDKQITITNTYNLRFKLGVFDHLKDITGKDGITFVQAAGTDIVYGCYALILAAARCYTDKHGGTVDADGLLKEIKTEADMKLFTDVIEMYSEFMNPNGNQVAEPAKPSPTRKFKNSPSDNLASVPGN